MSPYGRSARNWKATQRSHTRDNDFVLTVTGEVELRRKNEVPHLRPILPRDSVPTRLYLELTILSAGVGDAEKTWKAVQFERKITNSQYSGVEVLIEGRRVGYCDVEIAA
jgi:hypothetical protein